MKVCTVRIIQDGKDIDRFDLDFIAKFKPQWYDFIVSTAKKDVTLFYMKNVFKVHFAKI